MIASETRLRHVYEAAEEWIWETDKNGLYTFSSTIGENLLGYTSDEIVGKKHCYDLFEPSEAEELKKAAIKAFSKKEIFKDFISPNVHKDGRIVILTTSGTPVFDDDGNLQGYRGADRDITERIHAESELRSSEERMKLLFESAPDAYYIRDMSGKLLDCNKVTEDLFGYTAKEMIGKTFFELGVVIPEETEKVKAAINAQLEAEDIAPDEYTMIRKNGEKVEVEARAHRVQMEGRDVVLGIIRDVTERRKAQKAIEEREEKFRSIFDSISVVTTDEKGVIKEWNDGAEKVFGYSAKEIAGKSLTKLMPERYREMHNQGFSRATKSGGLSRPGTVHELYGLHKNGEEFPLEFSLGSWKRNDRIFFSAVMRDLTERKKNLRELKIMSTAMEQSPATVVITNLEGNIEYANPKFVETTGYSLDEVLGKNPRILKSGHTSDNEYKNLWETISKGDIWIGEFHNKRKDGSMYWERASIGPVVDDSGETTHYIAMKEDVSALKETEHKLRSTLRDMEAMVEERTEQLRLQSIEMERVYNNFMSSLEYAKRIQSASRPSKIEMNKAFKRHFEMYLPKDVVSGDFYWLYKSRKEVVFVVADCTGHGVPGAMMSMAGHEQLETIVLKREIRRPDIILEEMDLAIARLLKRKDARFNMNDGMDVSVVHINLNSYQMSFAGAQSRGLLISKNGLVDLKGNKSSIGGVNAGMDKDFNRSRFDFEPGDMLYLYTDGIYDQFGGKLGKKMLHRNFILKLKQVSSLSMIEQKLELEKWFKGWKGNLEQIDDVTVIGIEL